MREICDILRECEIYYLATIDKNRPKVRPFSTIDIYNNRLYILTGSNKDVSKEIQRNNRVELCALMDEENWIRVSGTLIISDDEDAKKCVLESNPHMKKSFRATDETLEVLYFDKLEAKIYCMDEEIKTIEV